MRSVYDDSWLTLAEALRSGILVHDEARIVYVNPAFAAMLDAEGSDALIGRPWWDLVHDDSHRQIRSTVDAILSGRIEGEGDLMTCRLVGLTGRVFDVEATAAPIDVGGHLGVRVVIHDLTARRTVEDALRDSEALRDRILHAIPGGFVHVSAEGAILSANDEACRILGLSWDRLSQRFTMDFELETIWEDGSPCPHDEYPVTRALTTGEPQPPTTIGVSRPDGVIAWAIFNALPVRDSTGQVSGALVTLLDVSPLKHAEEEADARANQQNVLSELGLRALVADDLDDLMRDVVDRVALTLAAPHCYILKRVEGEPGMVPRAGRGDLSEVDFDEVSGVGSPSDALLGDLGRAGAGDASVDPWLPERIPAERWPTGEVHISTRLVSTIHGRDEPYGAIFAQTDEPRDFKRDDQAFLDGVATLLAAAVERRRVERRRAELEAQLRQQQRLDSMGTLASGVAHEINNPIQGIMSYAELIRASAPADSRSRGWADEIVQGTERIAVIVRNLLAFARPEAAGRRPIIVRELVNKTLSLVRTVLRKDQITVELKIGDGLPTLECQGQQIQQVLMNLIVNARDALNARYPAFDPDKKVSVLAISLERRGQPWVRITVEDAGIGIPEDHLERIFDPFFTTKRQESGTGLGLSVSHGIIAEHGGRLWAESPPSARTRFHVELPVRSGGPGNLAS